MKKLKKQSLSWMMVFCMVISLFGGGVSDSTTAQAADSDAEAKIVTGKEAVNSDGYFTYPDLKVALKNDNELIHQISVSVDSGFMQIISTVLSDKSGGSVVGEGISSTSGNSEGSDFQTLDTGVRYSVLQFSSSTGFSASEVQSYLRKVRFSTAESGGQTITITATTLSDEDMVLKVGNTDIQLYYYGGHFYGYVPSYAMDGTWGISWTKAYEQTSQLEFNGVTGYLMTLTSRGEDRFIFSNFGDWDSTYAKVGWMGCSRDTVENIEAGTAGENLPKMTSHDDSNFDWRWVTGPEKGDVFGRQIYAYGDGGYGNMGDTEGLNDGGFKTADGYFSNWGTETETEKHVEPNGGATSNEAFGYYGEYKYGRWNDKQCTDVLAGYYIEFGGCDGDAEKFLENANTITVEVEAVIDSGTIINPDVDTTSLPICGVPKIVAESEEGNVVGKYLTIDFNTVGVTVAGTEISWDSTEWDNTTCGGSPQAFKSNLRAQWYTVDSDTGELKEIAGATDTSLKLTEDLINQQLVVKLTGDNGYVGTIKSAPYDATETVKELTPISGRPNIVSEDEVAQAGTRLTADVSGITPTGAQDSLIYQWYVKDRDGSEWTPIEGANLDTYVLTEDDLGKDIKVNVTGDNEEGYTGTVGSNWFKVPEAAATPAPTTVVTEAPSLSGKPIIKNNSDDGKNQVGTVLTADVSNVKGSDGTTNPPLSYQWYIQDESGALTPIEGATDSTYTLTQDDLDKDLVVAVTGTGDCGGTRNSEPYTAAENKIDLTGAPVIKNETTDDEGNPVVRKGTVLAADVAGVDPQESHDTLAYQWYIDKDGDGTFEAIDGATDAKYVIQAEDFQIGTGDDATEVNNPTYKVEVTGTGKYQGTLVSEPVEEQRTDSDVAIEESEEDGKRVIVLTPTQKNTIYGIKTADGTLITPPCVDASGNTITPSASYQGVDGYYLAQPGETLKFTVDKDKEYIISEIHQETSSTLIISPAIPDDTVNRTDYDNNGTPGDNTDDTISISVDPANTNLQYAILQKVDGKYEPITIKYNAVTGEYEKDPDSTSMYTNGGDGLVTFTGLPAEGTYKVVAIEQGTDPENVIGKELDSSQIEGGSGDHTFEAKAIQGTNTGSVNLVNNNSPAPTTQAPVSTDDAATDSVTPATQQPASTGNGNSDDVNTPDTGDTSTPVASDSGENTSAPVASDSGDKAGTTLQPTGSQTAAPTDTGVAVTTTPGSITTSVPGGITNTTTITLTQDEEDQVTKFIKEHATDSSGNIITEINDLTKDIILSGEDEWNKLTDSQKEVINQRLLDGGSPYTYQQLLDLANAYKIPSFKLHKVMKVKTKAKLKLLKCKGATVIVTSTNKKVATINKKGVIKAKKKGKARLTIIAVKGDYSNRLVVNIEVRKKFKNATELKKFKSKVIKTPTILIAKKRKLKKKTKIKIYGLEKSAKVQYKSYNKKAISINKKGKYTAKKKGRSLIRAIVHQNDKKYFLYLYVTAFKKGGKKK